MDEVDDLKDPLSVHERTGVTISADKPRAELGLPPASPNGGAHCSPVPER
jgi:hypothetical protein